MIRYASTNDFNDIQKLFNECFPEDINFNNFFFKNIYSHKNTIVYEENEKIISMIQCIPYYLEKIGDVTYIYGACTKEEHRGRGLMAKLINESFKDDIKNNIKASILIPQEKSLFDFYKNFGYMPAFYISSQTVQAGEECNEIALKNATKDDIFLLNSIYEKALKDSTYIKRDFKYWQTQISLFNALGGDVVIIFKNSIPLGYAFCWNANIPTIQEIFISPDLLDKSLNKIAKYYQKAKITFSQKGEEMPFGCIKFHSKNQTFEKAYMNLMFN